MARGHHWHFEVETTANERENLNDEYLAFENAGDEPLALPGWQIADEVGIRTRSRTDFRSLPRRQ